MLTKFLTSLGFTRDWFGWLWLRIISAAMLIDSLGPDVVTNTLNYIGVPCSPTTVHRVMFAAVALLWIAGKQAHSGLKSSAEMNSVTPPSQKETRV